MIKLKQLLIEGRYDRVTTELSRALINIIKANKKRGEIVFDFPGKRKVSIDYLPDLEFELETTLQYNIKYNKNAKLPFDIYGQADDETIELEMVVNPNYIPKIFSEIVPIIKDAIRHELEHVAQNNLNRPDSEKYENIPKDDFFKYLTARHEVPAFVRGLYKGAKTKKQSLSKSIDNFLSDYANRLSKSEQNKVRTIWTDYAKRNLPKAKFDV